MAINEDTDVVKDLTPLGAVTLSDDELELVLRSLAAYRDAKLRERGEVQPELPTVLLYEGDPLPSFDTLDGEILRVGSLIPHLYAGQMRRFLERREEVIGLPQSDRHQ